MRVERENFMLGGGLNFHVVVHAFTVKGCWHGQHLHSLDEEKLVHLDEVEKWRDQTECSDAGGFHFSCIFVQASQPPIERRYEV